MPLFRRYEGELVKSESLEQRILPFLMPRRSEALVFYEQQIDATPLLRWLEARNAGKEGPERTTVFQVALAAMVRAVAQRPKMNRFVAGNLLYQRRWIDISFVVKKEMSDDAAGSAIKVRFEPGDTLEDVERRSREGAKRGRRREHTSSEREMAFGLALPRLLLRAIVWAVRALDYLNLMPRSMIDADELFTSIFVANLGSVGLKAPFHHLYEWGTCPIFGVVGQIEKQPLVQPDGTVVARDVLPLRWTFDERIADGFYAAKSLELFKELLLDPERLVGGEKPPVPEPRGWRPEVSVAQV